MTHEQRYRTAPSPDGSSPVAMQARTTPLGTRRAAYSRTVRPMPLRSERHPHTTNPSAGNGDNCSCQQLCAKRPAAPRRASPLDVLDLRRSPSCRPSPVAACLSPLRCGQTVCSGRRCTAPPCASRGGRAAREGAAPRAICLSCHGARAGEWAHWSIGPWIAAVRAGGRARAWAVITGRVREPRAPGRFPHTRAPVQTAQQPHGATFVTRHACGAGPALRRKEVVDRSHDRPSQPHASIGSHRGRLRRPGAALEGPQARRRHIVRVVQSPTRPARPDQMAGPRRAGRPAGRTGGKARWPARWPATPKIGPDQPPNRAGRVAGRASGHRPPPLCGMRAQPEIGLTGVFFAHFFCGGRERCTFPAAPWPYAASPGSPSPRTRKSHHLPPSGSYDLVRVFTTAL